MSKFSVRTLISLLAVLTIFTAAAAQEATPRYSITRSSAGLSTDNCRVEFSYFVSNNGAASTSQSVLELRVLSQPDTILASAIIPPLEAGRGSAVSLSAPANEFPANGNQTFTAHVTQNGIDVFGAVPNTVLMGIPAVPDTCRAPGTATFPLYIPFLEYTIDLANPTRDELLFGGALLLVVLLFLLILLRLRRLLFGRPPAFGNHLPPYATTPPIDPYSQNGIRQSWQPYAQNNTITQPSVRGSNAVVKLLLGADGQYLNGWTITALRLSQYDQYGRVARTNTLGSLSMVRALNRLAHNGKPLDHDQLERRVTPLARQLVRQLLKRVTPRSAVLPVALDLRMKGSHGEVSIVFELYSSDGAQWHLLDRWQPEMSVTGKTIYETYTYTIHGQSGGESFKDFRQRLPLDMARLLSELIAPRVRPPTPTATQITTERPMLTPEAPIAPVAPPMDNESKG